ncbi:MAG: DUF167 domain-containing protein [Parachlamydiales bacterium]
MGDQALIIQVKVIPKSSENRVVGFEGEVLKVKCTAAPDKGKANDALVALLADYYDVPKRAVRIVRGETDSRKVVEIEKI